MTDALVFQRPSGYRGRLGNKQRLTHRSQLTVDSFKLSGVANLRSLTLEDCVSAVDPAQSRYGTHVRPLASKSTDAGIGYDTTLIVSLAISWKTLTWRASLVAVSEIKALVRCDGSRV